MKYVLAFVLSALLLGGLGGCGKNAPSDKPATGGSSASTPPAAGEAPKAADAAPKAESAGSGAKTPQAFLDKMEALSKSDTPSPVDIIALMHPDEQPAMAFVFSVIPLMLAPMMAAFADEETKAKLEPLMAGVETTLEKYGLQDAMQKLQGSEMPEDASDEDKLAMFNGMMKGVDHMALLRDSWTILEKLSEAKPGDGESEGPMEGFTSSLDAEKLQMARDTLKIDGDTATFQGPSKAGEEGDEPQTMVLVKAADGNWYLSALKSKMLGN
jgi:hypothetical protein